MFCKFFFSSRRRHTRLPRDWSSDVCSSDLPRLVVTGRSDDVFISAGENIQPRVIEQALTSMPGILQAVVVPVADDEYGARPVAFVGASREVEQERPRMALRRTVC